jgi:hypothetical protein
MVMSQTQMPHGNVLDVPENFIRFFAEFEVEPAEFSIVTTHDQMVPGRVNVHRGNPPYAGSKQFHELLLG